VTPSQPLDTPLWAFSLAVYGGDGVEGECLNLQERLNLDVNLLLFAAYIGAAKGVQLDGEDIATADAVVAGWHGEIVRALRRARRALKPASLDAGNPLHEPRATLRSQVKTAELEAERIEQAMLWQWSQSRFGSRPQGDRHRALAANLRGVLEFYDVASVEADAAAAVPHLLKAAAAYSRS
jgi:uncharacterized protein (TIGR02444 family)